MLPPKAANAMYSGINNTVPGFSVQARGSDQGTQLADEKVPKVILQAIDSLPDAKQISNDTRKYIMENVTRKLMENSERIHDWVHGKGGELAYWKVDFNDLLTHLCRKLEINEEEAKNIANMKAQVKAEETESEARGFQQTMSFMEEKIRQSSVDAMQLSEDLKNGKARPVTAEEIAQLRRKEYKADLKDAKKESYSRMCGNKDCNEFGKNRSSDGFKLRKCPCGTVYYCSKACQKAHWPVHKNICTTAKTR